MRPRWGRWSRTPKNSCARSRPLTYGVLRYLNTEVELAGSDPVIAFNYLGRLGGQPRCPVSYGGSARRAFRPLAPARSCRCRWGTPWSSTPAPSTRRWPALARRLDVGAFGLDRAQVSRLSRLWFEALAGICAHVRGGGGGLTPSDIALAGLSQQQIDELERQYADR